MNIEVSKEMMSAYLGVSSVGSWRIRVWSDGSWDTEQQNTYAACEVGKANDDDIYVVSSVNCLQVGELSTDFFTDENVEYNEETGTYFEIETGREVGELDDVVSECIRDGDMSNYFDELKTALGI